MPAHVDDSTVAGACGDLNGRACGGLVMTDFPKLEFSMHDVKRAGEALRGEILWDESKREELLDIFSIANSWIDSHAYPMFRLKSEAVAKVRKADAGGIVFARLKRMRSVRRKLATLPTAKLDQIQDLGGCRIICPSIASLNRVLDCYPDAPKHRLHNEKSYILAVRGLAGNVLAMANASASNVSSATF